MKTLLELQEIFGKQLDAIDSDLTPEVKEKAELIRDIGRNSLRAINTCLTYEKMKAENKVEDESRLKEMIGY